MPLKVGSYLLSVKNKLFVLKSNNFLKRRRNVLIVTGTRVDIFTHKLTKYRILPNKDKNSTTTFTQTVQFLFKNYTSKSAPSGNIKIFNAEKIIYRIHRSPVR